MEKNFCIFNFKHLIQFKRFLNLQTAILVLICLSLAVWPYYAFDKISIPVFLIVEVILFISGILCLKNSKLLFICFISTLIVFLIVGELFTRIKYFGVDGLSFSKFRPASYAHPLSSFEYSSKTYTGLKPDSVVMFKGVEFKVNSSGFRGKNYSLIKPKNTYRIALIGASASMGAGVKEEERFSAVIEKELSRHFSRKKIEVINFSIGKNKWPNMLHLFENIALSYDPDCVMILYIHEKSDNIKFRSSGKVKKHNIPLFRLISRPNSNFLRNFFFLARNLNASRVQVFSEIKNHFSFINMGNGATEEMKYRSREKKYNGIKNGLELINNLKGERLTVIYLLHSVKYQKNHFSDNEYNTYLKNKTKKYGIHIIDTHTKEYTKKYSQFKDSELIIYPGDNHPSAIVHKMIGITIYEQLLPLIVNDLNQKLKPATN